MEPHKGANVFMSSAAVHSSLPQFFATVQSTLPQYSTAIHIDIWQEFGICQSGTRNGKNGGRIRLEDWRLEEHADRELSRPDLTWPEE